MIALTDQEASELLADRYSAVMRGSIILAWEDWESGPCLQMQTTSFRAQYMNNQIIYHAKQLCVGVEGIQVDKIHDNFGFVVQGRVFIRPKFARERHLSSNYPTKSAIAFHDQEVDLFDGVARLELVYTLSPLGTSIQDICLSQRDKKKIMWLLPLRDQSDSVQDNLIQMPTPDRPGSAADKIIKPIRKPHDPLQDDQQERGADS